jgi:phytanoyl-CoA hydroxylase
VVGHAQQQNRQGPRQPVKWPCARIGDHVAMHTHITPGPLTPAERAAYDRDGFHIARGVVPPDALAELRETFMALASRGPIPGFSALPPSMTATDPLARYPRMMHPHIHPEHPAACALARRWLLDASLQGILQDLMGEPPVAAQSMFYFKPPGARGQDFHQDNFYLQVRPTTCMAAWMAIDAADAGNGGLMVASGSHRLPTLATSQADRSRSMADELVDIPAGCAIVSPELAAGDVLFFNGQLIHGSEPNASATRFRRALICHYLPASSQSIGAGYLPAVVGFDGAPVAFAASDGQVQGVH